jgi:hypothetical protein
MVCRAEGVSTGQGCSRSTQYGDVVPCLAPYLPSNEPLKLSNPEGKTRCNAGENKDKINSVSGVGRMTVPQGDALTSQNESRPPMLLLMEGIGRSHPGCAKVRKVARERAGLALDSYWTIGV